MEWVFGIVALAVSTVIASLAIILRLELRNKDEQRRQLNIIRKRRPRTKIDSVSRALEIMAEDMRGRKPSGN